MDAFTASIALALTIDQADPFLWPIGFQQIGELAGAIAESLSFDRVGTSCRFFVAPAAAQPFQQIGRFVGGGHKVEVELVNPARRFEFTVEEGNQEAGQR